mgnify:CR=1 FL=1
MQVQEPCGIAAAAMWQVHCFPLCPFSRKVRLALAEKGVPFELVRTRPWDASDEFWALIEGPVDLLFCNLEEARSLTSLQDPIDCAQQIHRHAENVALTLGEKGSILMHRGEAIPVEGASEREKRQMDAVMR